ncbi:MAG: 1,4-dihydroxy-2-naphthoate octaprenyltransferase [Promethearchaeota archaeon]
MVEVPLMKQSSIKLWFNATRPKFLTAVIVPIILGSVIAFVYENAFYPLYFILALFGGISLHAGTNIANDYFDFKSGTDVINKEVTPFSGGSDFLREGILKPRDVLIASIILLGIGIAIGLYFTFVIGWFLLLLGLIGALCGFFYVGLASKGLGEAAIGINFGPLCVIGAYYVQTAKITLIPLIASIPIAFLITAVVWINQFPDYVADKEVGKDHLVVRLGRSLSAVRVYHGLIIGTYVAIALSIIFSFLPLFCLISFITLPLFAIPGMKIAHKNYLDTPKLIPAQAMTIMTHLFTGILLIVGFLIHYFVLIVL